MAVLIVKPIKRPKHKKKSISESEQPDTFKMSKEDKAEHLKELKAFFAEHHKKEDSKLTSQEKKTKPKKTGSPKVPEIKEGRYKGDNICSINIPDNIEIISKYAFANCKHLKRVNFGEHSRIRIIENSAFRGCSKLKEINFPKKQIWVYETNIDFSKINQKKLDKIITLLTKPISYKQINRKKKIARRTHYTHKTTPSEAKGRHYSWYRPK